MNWRDRQRFRRLQRGDRDIEAMKPLYNEIADLKQKLVEAKRESEFLRRDFETIQTEIADLKRQLVNMTRKRDFWYEACLIDNQHLSCYDCGLIYAGDHWVEAIIPDDIWEKIENLNKPINMGIILCINCIAKRCNDLGLKDVPLKITAGPFKNAN